LRGGTVAHLLPNLLIVIADLFAACVKTASTMEQNKTPSIGRQAHVPSSRICHLISSMGHLPQFPSVVACSEFMGLRVVTDDQCLAVHSDPIPRVCVMIGPRH
jgi:hypothetical protein